MKNPLTPVQILAIQALVQEEGLSIAQVQALEMNQLIPPTINNGPGLTINGAIKEIGLQTWIFIQDVCSEKPRHNSFVFVVPEKVKKEQERGADYIYVADIIPHLHPIF